MMFRSNEEIIIRADRRISAILTSYEIVCATLRSAPRRAYFLFDVHPAASTVYTFSLEIHRNIRIPYGRKYDADDIGNSDHRIMARRSLIIGAIRNGDILASFGLDCSFRNSFSASARGCGRPIIPTLFGPLRVWKYPSIFRSSRV